MQIAGKDIDSLRLNHNTAIFAVNSNTFLDQACEYMRISPCKQLEKIIDFSRKKLDAQTAVVEREYVDADFLHDYSEFYCKTFLPPYSKCGRIHLFACSEIGPEHLLSLDNLGKHYLGYVVVRPTGRTAVGRTCLRYRPMHHDKEYLLCEYDFPVHINGARLAVKAFPFISQDSNTFVCAGAAMWMQAFYMHERFHFPRFYPAEITRQAMRYSVAGNARTGLRFDQMSTALREMGYNPHVYSYLLEGLSEDMKRLALRRAVLTGHALVESRIPCIFGIGFKDGNGHALTAIGHSFERPSDDRANEFLSPTSPRDAFSGTLFNGDWVSWLVIHDDQDVPYGRLWIWDKPAGASEYEYCLAKNVRNIVILVPMPREVAMEFEHAVIHARRAFAWWNDWVEGAMKDPGWFAQVWEGYSDVSTEWRIDQDDDVVWRVYLEPSEDFKERVKSTGMNEDFKKAYQAMTFPKYVWIAEMAARDRLNAPEEKDRTIKGEVVIDATANPYLSFPPILAFQYKGRFACCPSRFPAPVMLFRKGAPEEYSPGHRGTTDSPGSAPPST